MMKAANQRKFDMILVWSIDRLGRSLQNLVELLNDLQSMRVDLMFLQQAMDTNTSSGRMMFSIFGALAEFERNLIRERVIPGQNRAKARGVKMGRPSNMNDGLRSAIQLLRENGMGIKQIAKEVGVGVGVGTVYSMIVKLKITSVLFEYLHGGKLNEK